MYIYKKCKCGQVKENPKNNYCNSCRKIYYQNSKKKQTSLNHNVMEFVSLIESRKGGCNLKELLVDLITHYYNIIIKDVIDNKLPAGKQLELMYKELKNWCGIKDI